MLRNSLFSILAALLTCTCAMPMITETKSSATTGTVNGQVVVQEVLSQIFPNNPQIGDLIQDYAQDEASCHVLLSKKIDTYIQAYVDLGQFNGSVLVAKRGKFLVNKSYGTANVEQKVPCTNQTRFNLASITKQFTAMAIMLLVQKGLVRVDDLITKFMPTDLVLSDPRAATITIHHCLTHTCGIKDFESLAEWNSSTQYKNASEIIKLFKDKSLDFKPGTRFGYSNSGFIVLGYIVEQVSGQSLAQFMKENIFQPLNMKNTGFDYNPADEKFAVGYARGNRRLTYYDMSFAYGDGNLLSTAEDLYLWSQALSSETLLRSNLSKMLFTPHVKAEEDQEIDYGYGWYLTKLFGHELIFHCGGIPGFTSAIYRFVSDDVCIIVLSNVDPDLSPACSMSNDIAAILFAA